MALGRPRAFDTKAALDRAIEVFWRKGYEGASLADLTSAMGISSPSLYAAFGSKEGLFRASLERYDESRAAALTAVLAAPTAREVARRYLEIVLANATDPNGPPGCLLVQSGLSCSEDASCVPEELARRRKEGEQALCRRFERAKAEGELSAGEDPAALALYLGAVGNGIAVQAASGARREDLEMVARLALAGWPLASGAPGAKELASSINL